MISEELSNESRMLRTKLHELGAELARAQAYVSEAIFHPDLKKIGKTRKAAKMVMERMTFFIAVADRYADARYKLQDHIDTHGY